jgi:hypothetical protein
MITVQSAHFLQHDGLRRVLYDSSQGNPAPFRRIAMGSWETSVVLSSHYEMIWNQQTTSVSKLVSGA